MSSKTVIVFFVLLTALILFGGVYVLSATNQASPDVSSSKNAKAAVSESFNYDWGNIAYDKGVVTKDFTIKNTGSDKLKIFNVKTSCHCTKAHVTINGNESQDFGMDGLSSWVGEVAPGEKATLTAIFDPAFHGPQGIGPVNRFVSIETNDSAQSKLTFTLTGKVVK